MPTSDASWSGSLRVVGDLERPDHYYLSTSDACMFFGEYTPRAGFAHSSTNQLVSNLKKGTDKRGTPQWQWKLKAIDEVARAIADNIKPEFYREMTFVPIPPSKPRGHPEYDDRMFQVAKAIGPQADVRDILATAAVRDPAHLNQNQRDPVALKGSLILDRARLRPAPKLVVLIDDVITTGCSFTVCREILEAEWPDAHFVGIFAARRIIPNPFADLL